VSLLSLSAASPNPLPTRRQTKNPGNTAITSAVTFEAIVTPAEIIEALKVKHFFAKTSINILFYFEFRSHYLK